MPPFFDFFKKKATHQSILSEKVKGLTDRQKSKFDYIGTQYKRFSSKAKHSPTLLQAFLDRYDRSIKQQVPIDDFLQIEEEALEIYKKKQQELKEKEKVDSKIAEQDQSFKKPQIDNTLEHRLSQYPRPFIHGKADPTLERLLGALVSFEKKYKNGLFQATKIINEAEFHQIVYNVVYGLEDFSQMEGNQLPFAFSQYSFALDKDDVNKDKIAQDITTNVAVVFDKIQKIILWGKRRSNHATPTGPFATFIINNAAYNFWEFFDVLKLDTNNIIRDFKLKVDQVS